MMNNHPLIFDIRRGSLADGPGMRSIVFFKGCPLACVWCHNPESMSEKTEIFFDKALCIGAACSKCSPVCAGSKKNNGSALKPGIKGCSACGGCAVVCPSGARREVGRTYTMEELCEILLDDIKFYQDSHGGVTLSGGEPTLHHDYVARLLRWLKGFNIHTAIQTCGLFEYEAFHIDLLPSLDIIYFDLKFVDTVLHHKYTGGDSHSILANLSALALCAKDRLVVRVPLVPGITATEENLSAIARFGKELNLVSWELLPYNPGALIKRAMLAKRIPSGLPLSFMDRCEEERLRAFFWEQLGG